MTFRGGDLCDWMYFTARGLPCDMLHNARDSPLLALEALHRRGIGFELRLCFRMAPLGKAGPSSVGTMAGGVDVLHPHVCDTSHPSRFIHLRPHVRITAPSMSLGWPSPPHVQVQGSTPFLVPVFMHVLTPRLALRPPLNPRGPRHPASPTFASPGFSPRRDEGGLFPRPVGFVGRGHRPRPSLCWDFS